MVELSDEELLALFGPLAVGYVLHDPDAIPEAPTVIVDSRGRDLNPDHRAILATVALLERVALQLACNVPRENGPFPIGVLRIGQIKKAEFQKFAS
jgi:hypothetical protein